MSREIKFRFWDIKNKEFIFSNLNEIFDTDWVGMPSKQFVFQQYTGLKDKNDREIYEGDIISFKENVNEKHIGEVTMMTDSGASVITDRFKGYNTGSGLSNFSTSETRNNADYYALEKIGNIYENPDLLKKI